ncbi:MAG: TatD family hydrolase [Thaumarchaeota archaeon]|nr:TatD family hydrolase [Nitrososphaerota archaeon]
MNLVDAHVHLASYGSHAEVIGAAKATRTTLLSCTVNAAEATVNLGLRDENPGTVRCFLGVHPSDVSEKLPSDVLGDLFSKADGVGEIGLDAKYSDATPGSLQMKAFLDQLGVAERLGKPVEVHSRGSEAACLAALTSFKPKSVLMHWFEGEDEIREVASRGYYVSVGPAILYSKKIRRIASSALGGSLLTESDGPVSYKALGGRSGPALVPSVVFRLAETRGTSFEDQAREVEGNLHRFLSGT